MSERDDAVAALIALGVAIAAYLAFLYLFFRYVSFWLFTAAALFATGVMAFNFGKALWRGAKRQLPSALSDAPTGSEPAYKAYFFRRAWQDLRDLLRENYLLNRRFVEWGMAWTMPPLSGDRLFFTWPLLVTLGLAAIAGGLVALALNAALALLAALLTGSAVGGALLLTGLARLAESAQVTVRGFSNHCVHAGCYRRFSLPAYACPGCGRRHRRLLPGSYGVVRRRCACGTLLPTTYLLGRHRLAAFCPHCERALDDEAPDRRPALLPLVGARSSGKSSFQVALLLAIEARAAATGSCFRFVSRQEELAFRQVAAQMARTSSPPASQDLARALQVDCDLAGRRLRLHFYDAAGERFQDEERLRPLHYLEHCDGVFLVVDPFSFPRVRARHPDRLRDVSPSRESAEEVYSRLLDFLEANEVPTKGRLALRIAVLVTKVDALRRGSFAGEDEDAAVQDWLRAQGQGRFVDLVTHKFEHHRFFAVSAVPGGSRSPEDVLKPFDWILESRGHARPLP